MDSYRDNYLRSDHWAAKRSQVLLERGQKCELCRSIKELDVHHLNYRKLYRESVNDLRVVCRSCHDKVHRLLRKYPKLKEQHNAKQWFIVYTRIAGKKPPPSRQSHINTFGLCVDVLVSMRLVKRFRMPWREVLLKKKVRYSVPLIALRQYIEITGLDPRYRADRIGPQKLLTFSISPMIRKAGERLYSLGPYENQGLVVRGKGQGMSPLACRKSHVK